jgi:hypothetical protein
MSEEPLDLRRSMQILRRHLRTIGILAVLGAVVGGGYGHFRPPMFSSSALVAFPLTTRDISTQVVIASSDHVLAAALPHVDPHMSLVTLQGRIHIKSLTTNIVAIGAQGKTAVEAEDTANAVASSFMAYVGSNNSAAGKVPTRLLQPATSASGTSPVKSAIIVGLLGLLIGLFLGVVGVLAIRRGDRRLRWRDEIADAIGIPVLASLDVKLPRDPAGWARLLDGYQPAVSVAWRLRNSLHYLGLSDMAPGTARVSVTVLSLSSDKKALALGPQVAAFAASQGIRTALHIGEQDTKITATLRAACSAHSGTPRRSGNLLITVAPDGSRQQPGAALTVIVAVVDAQDPQLDGLIDYGAAVLAVSAGAVTAEQLARVASSAGSTGHPLDGILVGDPDPSDQTTGRIPQLGPVRRVRPTRLSGMTMDTRK